MRPQPTDRIRAEVWQTPDPVSAERLPKAATMAASSFGVACATWFGAWAGVVVRVVKVADGVAGPPQPTAKMHSAVARAGIANR
ncbi:MAG: hypothetical protein WCI34_04000 [Actinomycetes bacterium]